MAVAVPDFPAFDVDTKPTSLFQRRRKWIIKVDNLLLAWDIQDLKRGKALIIYYAGQGVHDIFDTLTDPSTESEDEV